MVKRLRQAEFEAAEFDSGGFNLHQHDQQHGRPATLVVLVHGLGGRGYETWEPLPGRIFNANDDHPIDVGLFYYPSSLRGIFRRTGKFEFWWKQLAGQLRQVESEYSDIFLVGHSLGGLLVEAVAKNYVETRALEHQEGPFRLAGLVVVASPRAGSGWARRPFQLVLPELSVLRRFNPHGAEIEEFFTTHVERRNVTVGPPHIEVLPVYAALGGGDKLVKPFSAAGGIPSRQRLLLNAGHRSIVRPNEAENPLIDWLRRTVIAGRLEVREQATREQQFVSERPVLATADARFRVVTRLLTDPSGLLWEELYNEVRRDATSTTVVVEDMRDAPGADIDLLIAIHDAASIVAHDPAIRAKVQQAHAEQARQQSMSVGICPVGWNHVEAVATVHEWLADRPVPDSFYVKGAADIADVREIVARLLHLIIDRRPRRVGQAALAEQELSELNDILGDHREGGL